MTKPTSLFLALILATPFGFSHKADAEQEFSLGAPFADQAVLQHGMKVPVWGWAKPGSKISVSFAGQKKEAMAGENGKWMIELDELEASFEPREMIIAASGETSKTLKDILVGEVWMASGQSNMQWLASACDVGRVLQKQIAARVEAGEEKPPVIRESKITNYFAAPQPIEHATAVWSTDAPNFSAVSFAFAYELYRELNVPIGILNCSFSQTSIQAWTPREGFAEGADEYTKAIHQKVLESDPTTPEHKAAWDKFYQQIEDTIAANKELVAKGEIAKKISTRAPGIMNENREATWLFNARINPMIPYAIRGCIWNQGYANIHEGIFYYNNLHSLIRGWRKVWNRPDLPVYFHQFYSPGFKEAPEIDQMGGMRMGALLARDIPNTGMACQIDIAGAIHYFNKALPGKRLALHALKNQYGKDIASDGPIFKSYEVKGPQLIVSFDHADGLQVGETLTNSKENLAIPTPIENGESQIKLFFLAGEDRVWHPATVKIDGDKVIVSSPEVPSPRGVSYATGGVGNQPNLYNKALLPASPFIAYDNAMVTTETWPKQQLKIAGAAPLNENFELLEEYRKLPILSSQFVDNAVLQADVPVTIWGAANVFWGEPKDIVNGVIKFSFDGKEQSIPVTPGMREWSLTLPPTQAGSKAHTIRAWMEIDGKTVVERSAQNVVFGDVYYVAAPADLKFEKTEKVPGILRAITRKAKGSTSDFPRRFAVSTSTSPPDQNRFASLWEDASDEALAIANALAKGTERPVGLIFMRTHKDKGTPRDALLKEWIAAEHLNLAPSLMEDYKQLAAIRPGNEFFDANARNYISAWKTYWSEYVPAIMKTKSVPDAAAWGSFPTLNASVKTTASYTNNVLVESFTPAALKGIIFISSPDMVAEDEGALFAEQMTALANSMKKKFGGEDVPFIYTMPAKSLAPKVTAPSSIEGKSKALEINDWHDGSAVLKGISGAF